MRSNEETCAADAKIDRISCVNSHNFDDKTGRNGAKKQV